MVEAMCKNENIIDFKNIFVNYGMTTVLENINLEIKKGEHWAILGANGSGKSTLMKLFSNDLYPNAKYDFKKEIFGKDRWDIFELKNHLGIITNDIQNNLLNYCANASGFDIVLSGYYSSFGTFSHQSFSDRQYLRANNIMEFLEITKLKNKEFRQMSTGEQRRCIIGRALVHKPEAFVLDEPTTGLDVRSQMGFLRVLRKLSRKSSIILVTHNVEEIFPEITNVALIYQNTIYKKGTKDEIMTSENLSEIFGCDVELQKDNNKFYIRTYNW